jgi:hypothetical protein
MSEHKDLERHDAAPPRPAVRGEEQSGERGALDLQRRAGNRATAAFVQRRLDPRARATDPAVASTLAALDGARPLEPAGDATAEADADAVASRAPLPTGPLDLPATGPLPPAVATPLRPDLGDLAAVRVHAGDEATSAARRLGARAFAQGTDVYVDRDELAAPGAAQLLAHEATHAARHDPKVVHAKMRGVKDALVNQGGGRTTKGIRRVVPGTKTNWDKIVDSVAAYEKLEASLLAKNPSRQALAAARPKMVKALQAIEAAVVKWRQANNEAGAQQWSESAQADFREDDDFDPDSGKGKPTLQDGREKAGRRQAINMLLPRVRTELADVAAGQWGRTLGLSDAQLVATGDSQSGQMNTVTELTYQSDDGDFSGFFKADKGFDAAPAWQGLDVGIRQADPNYSARSVAMYRLDQLLGAGVTARAEFAVHDGRMGLALESAKGVRAVDANMALSQAAAQAAGPGAYSVDDKVLLQCLNKLQILDAIAGQLDRHGGNYFIQGEGNRVTGVTGIDLDLAFGQDQASYDDPKARKVDNYKSMPSEIDEDFGRRVLAVSADDVRAVLRGLLTPMEVEATVQRLESVRAVVQEKADANQLRSKWDEPGASPRLASAAELDHVYNRTTYAVDLQSGAINRIEERVRTVVRTAAWKQLGLELPGPTIETIIRALAPEDATSDFAAVVQSGVYEGGVPPEEEEALALHVFDYLLGDQAAREEIELRCQEDEHPVNQVRTIFKQLIIAKRADILASYRR